MNGCRSLPVPTRGLSGASERQHSLPLARFADVPGLLPGCRLSLHEAAHGYELSDRVTKRYFTSLCLSFLIVKEIILVRNLQAQAD